MFGCIVAGRLIQTNLQQIDETHAIFELPNASTINHICEAVDESQCACAVPFPDGFGATVHFHWPGKGFQLLGALSNEKPSAIFRVRGTFSATSTLTHAAFHDPSNPSSIPNAADVTAILGIAVEPLTSIQASLAALPSAVAARSPLSDPSFLAEKIVKHLFNYLAGFAEGELTPETFVPMGVITRWYESFLSKIRAGGAGFLEREE
ncbi:DUF775-domain-containing protein [Sanghuangporus baumii]|uniref:DUF775-domain-containing protein n=1 Tax=Sanghuangporus baumii TaxID=108892 RepID=A0A9Q5HZ47_SANBA|nr:DUF775-domain-containing protein [Sanghuangporus baumii]